MLIRHMRSLVFVLNGERGSLLGGSALLVLLMLMFAVFGVDLTNYFLTTLQTQQLADNASTTGAVALSQYAEDPDKAHAYRAVLRFIELNQGPEFRDLYEVHSPTDVEGITVERLYDASSGDTIYRVGVMIHNQFEPFFLPPAVFGNKPYSIHRHAVAQVNGKYLQKIVRQLIDCGVIANNGVALDGNNIDSSKAKLCSNGDILAGGSSANKYVGETYRLEGSQIECPTSTGGCETTTTFPDPRSIPEFQYDDPGAYDVSTQEYSTWNQGSCSVGKTLPQATWSLQSSEPVCVERTLEDQDEDGIAEYPSYRFLKANGNKPHHYGPMLTPSGTRFTMYVDGDVTFDMNDAGLMGGLYATGDIAVTGNNNLFLGDSTLLGGLALWSQDGLSVDVNSITVEGIMGTEGSADIQIGGSGGGDGTNIRGMVVTTAAFDLTNNSGEADIVYDESIIDLDAINGLENWSTTKLEQLDQPYFSTTYVKLID